MQIHKYKLTDDMKLAMYLEIACRHVTM